MIIKDHTRIDLAQGGTRFKQGDFVELAFTPRDAAGKVVDLTGKDIEVSIWNRSKGVIYQGAASFDSAEKLIRVTIKETLDHGKFQIEFTVTDSTDADYRRKFPSDEYNGVINITPSTDNMDVVGVQMTTVSQLRNEQAQLQQEFESQVLPRVDTVEGKQTQLEADYQAAAGALTEDSEVILARKGEPTLRAFNDKVVAQLAETADQLFINTQPQYLDLHYEISKGVGWVEDPNPTVNSYITISAALGAKSLTVLDATPYRNGQLIVIRDFTNDVYLINKITTIAGNVINLEFPLERAIGNGNRVYKFYINYAHPTAEGYNAIADYVMMKKLGFDEQSVYQLSASMFTIGSSVDGTFVGYKTPSEPFKNATLNLYDKINVAMNIEGGVYDVSLIMNLVNAVNVRFEVSRASDNVQVFGQRLTTSDTVTSHDYKINLPSGRYNFYVANVDATPATVLFKGMSLAKVIDANNLKKMDNKRHVFLGDSWFADGTFIARIKKYLPNAELLNYGVGGNRMDNLLRRFNGLATTADRTATLSDANWDVRKNVNIDKIDYIWVMCGTNDYFANKAAATFHQELNTLISDITKRGAKPIVFNASVGDIGKGAGVTTVDILKLSRQYSSFNLQEYPFFNKKLEEVITTTIPISFDVATGSKVISSIYIKDRIVEIEQVTFNVGAGKSIDIGFGDINAQTTSLANVVNFTQNITQKTPITTKDSRFLNIVLKNENASAVTFFGAVVLRLKPLGY